MDHDVCAGRTPCLENSSLSPMPKLLGGGRAIGALLILKRG